MLTVADVLEYPFDPAAWRSFLRARRSPRVPNLGAPVTINGSASPAACWFIEAARRLAGETVPMVIPDEKRTFFNRLFGRRAA